MKRILTKWFGKEWYCGTFHSAYEINNKWNCYSCNLTYDKKLSDNYLGPL